jgi:HK97 family phage major capsid protein
MAHVLTAAEIRKAHVISDGEDPAGALGAVDASLSQLQEQRQTIHDAAGNASLTASQQRAWNALDAAETDLTTLRQELVEEVTADAETRAERVRASRAKFGSQKMGNGTNLSHHSRNETRAWDGFDRAGSVFALGNDAELRDRALVATAEMPGLESRSRERVTEMIELDRGPDSSRFILAAGNPAYRSAFDKWIRDPAMAAMTLTPAEAAAWRDVSEMRTAMSLTTGAALLPLQLDPTIVITNGGSALDIRQYCRTRTAVTNSYRAVTSAGVTAEVKVEGAQAADASPSLSAVDVPVWLMAASVTASYEIFQDSDLASQLGVLYGDAFLNQENSLFISGDGVAQPQGVITAISATAGSTVTATTRGSFTTASYPDVFRVRDALPARERNSSGCAWVSNIAYSSIIQQIGIANAGANAFWDDMSSGEPARLLGKPNLEATSMSAAQTSGTVGMVLGDFQQYLIADRLGTTVHPPANVVGSNGRSTGQYEFFAFRRYGAKVLNVDAFRFLKM